MAMSGIKPIITDSLITEEDELLIKKLSIIDGNTGEELRVAKVTPELKQLLDACEIDVENYLQFAEMARKNPAIKKLVNEFNLILTS